MPSEHLHRLPIETVEPPSLGIFKNCPNVDLVNMFLHKSLSRLFFCQFFLWIAGYCDWQETWEHSTIRYTISALFALLYYLIFFAQPSAVLQMYKIHFPTVSGRTQKTIEIIEIYFLFSEMFSILEMSIWVEWNNSFSYYVQKAHNIHWCTLNL